MSSPSTSASLEPEARRIADEALRFGIGLSPAGALQRPPAAPWNTTLTSDEDIDPIRHIGHFFGRDDDDGPSSPSMDSSMRKARSASKPNHKQKTEDDVRLLFPKPGREVEFACGMSVKTILDGVNKSNEPSTRRFLDEMNPSKKTKSGNRKRKSKTLETGPSTGDSLYGEYPDGVSLVSIVLFSERGFGSVCVTESNLVRRKEYRLSIPEQESMAPTVEQDGSKVDEYQHVNRISHVTSTISAIWFVDALSGALWIWPWRKSLFETSDPKPFTAHRGHDLFQLAGKRIVELKSSRMRVVLRTEDGCIATMVDDSLVDMYSMSTLPEHCKRTMFEDNFKATSASSKSSSLSSSSASPTSTSTRPYLTSSKQQEIWGRLKAVTRGLKSKSDPRFTAALSVATLTMRSWEAIHARLESGCRKYASLSDKDPVASLSCSDNLVVAKSKSGKVYTWEVPKVMSAKHESSNGRTSFSTFYETPGPATPAEKGPSSTSNPGLFASASPSREVSGQQCVGRFVTSRGSMIGAKVTISCINDEIPCMGTVVEDDKSQPANNLEATPHTENSNDSSSIIANNRTHEDSLNGSSDSGSSNPSGSGFLRVRMMNMAGLIELSDNTNDGSIENNFWRQLMNRTDYLPTNISNEVLLPREQCRVVDFPPPLGKVIAVDGPFCVVDTSSSSDSIRSSSPKSQKTSNIKVCLAKDLELLPITGIPDGPDGPDGDQGDFPANLPKNYTNVFHFEPSQLRVSPRLLRGPRQESKVFEGPHPYSNNMDLTERISFPGAEKLLVRFHPETVTESSCDYIVFEKVGSQDGDSKYWGYPRYSGSSGSSNWPGVGSSSPLEIKADKFDFKFHSDGSCTYWGWKFTVQAFYPTKTPVKALFRPNPKGQMDNGGETEPFALAAQAIYGDNVQVLWQRHRLVNSERPAMDHISVRDPSIILTQTCPRNEAHSSTKTLHSSASSSQIAGDEMADSVEDSEQEEYTPSRVLQKSQHNAFLSEGARFEGGFLLDRYDSILLAHEGAAAMRNFGICGFDRHEDVKNGDDFKRHMLPKYSPVLSASISKFCSVEVRLWNYRRLKFIPHLFRKQRQRPDAEVFQSGDILASSLRPYRECESLYEERSAHGRNLLHWLALAPSEVLSTVSLMDMFCLRPNFREKSTTSLQALNPNVSVSKALMKAWMAKDSCGRTPFMLAVTSGKFQNATFMLCVCVTSAYDLIVKATKLSSITCGGPLTPFLLESFEKVLQDQYACIFECDTSDRRYKHQKEPESTLNLMKSRSMSSSSTVANNNLSAGNPTPRKRRRVGTNVNIITSQNEVLHDEVLHDEFISEVRKRGKNIAKYTSGPVLHAWFNGSAMQAYRKFIEEYNLEKARVEKDLLDWEHDVETIVNSMLEPDLLGRCPFDILLELLIEPIEVYAMRTNLCSCDRCYRSIESIIAQKSDTFLRTLFLHLAGNRLMPQRLGKAVLFTVVEKVYQGDPRLPSNAASPGKDGMFGSGGGHGPDGLVGHVSSFLSPRCEQAFSMAVNKYADKVQRCDECGKAVDHPENNLFGKWWHCYHCCTIYCFNCRPGPPAPMDKTTSIMKSIAKCPILIMQALAAPESAHIDSFVHHVVLTDYLFEGFKSGLDNIVRHYRTMHKEWDREGGLYEGEILPNELRMLESSEFAETIASSVARVFCSILCSQHMWPSKLEKATWIRTPDLNNGGYTGQPGSGVEEARVRVKSVILGGVAERISERCMEIFKCFPDTSVSCLARFASKVIEHIVAPTRGFSCASSDHNDLLNPDPMSWLEEEYVPSSGSLRFGQLPASQIDDETPYAWCARTGMAAYEDYAKGNPPPPIGASFSRIIAAICSIVSPFYEEIECGHLGEESNHQSTSGGAGGAGFVSLKSRTVLTNAVQHIIYSTLKNELEYVKKWALSKLVKIDEVYQRGIGAMRDMGLLNAQLGSRSNQRLSLRAKEETFSSSRVLMDIFRRGSSFENNNASSSLMSVSTGWSSPAPTNNAKRSKPVNASSAHSTVWDNQLPLLDLSTKQCESVIFVVGSLLELNFATKGHCGFNIDDPLLGKTGTIRALASSHWEKLCSEPGLTRSLSVASLPVSFSLKEAAFKRRVKEFRYRTFSGNKAVEELNLEIKVLRSQLLASSMGEISTALEEKSFPEFRRPITIESSTDRTFRVNFIGEQGSGPGVTRGWFSAVTKALHSVIDSPAMSTPNSGSSNSSSSSSSSSSGSGVASKSMKMAYRIGGGSQAPIAPTYHLFPSDGAHFRDRPYFTISEIFREMMTDLNTRVLEMMPTSAFEDAPQGKSNLMGKIKKINDFLDSSKHTVVAELPASYAMNSFEKFVREFYVFLGRFLGLAISCGERLNISFAPHVARYLMGQPANLSDLRYLDPGLHKQLVSLLRLKKEGK